MLDPLAEAVALAERGGPDPGWTDDALCAQTAPEVFIGGDSTDLQIARAICALCHVRTECAADGLVVAREGYDPGVRGGQSARAIRRAAGLHITTTRTRASGDKHIVRARLAEQAGSGQTVAELAAQHGVSERTMQRWITAGKAA